MHIALGHSFANFPAICLHNVALRNLHPASRQAQVIVEDVCILYLYLLTTLGVGVLEKKTLSTQRCSKHALTAAGRTAYATLMYNISQKMMARRTLVAA